MAIAPTAAYTQTKQEFLNSVLNKIGKQEFSNKTYTNPLKRLRGQFIEGPTDIEEIYVDRASDEGEQLEGTGSLDRKKPSTHVQYHTNIQPHHYKVTVHNKQMRKGFLNANGLQTMAQAIINSLHTGQELDDYQDCINTLKALVAAPKGSKANVIEVDAVTSETTSKQFTKAIKKTIHKMKDYGSVYSDMPSYAEASELILFIDSDTDVEVEIEHLASAFNMTVAQLSETSKIVIPNMKTKLGSNTIAVLAHSKCIKINPCYYDLDSVKNTRGKFVNYDLATETLLSYTTWFPHAVIKEKSAA